MKFLGYYFYLNANIEGDFQIYISVPLKEDKKAQVSNIFKNNENRGGISLYNSTKNELFQTLVLFQIFGKGL